MVKYFKKSTSTFFSLMILLLTSATLFRIWSSCFDFRHYRIGDSYHKLPLWARSMRAKLWIDQEVQPSPFMYWLYHRLIMCTLSAPVQKSQCTGQYQWYFNYLHLYDRMLAIIWSIDIQILIQRLIFLRHSYSCWLYLPML